EQSGSSEVKGFSDTQNRHNRWRPRFTHNLTVKLNVSIETNLDVKCKITADEIEARKSLKVDNIDVGNHTHGGVETGNGSTGTPQ
ncbi:MAG: hypothetical protein ACL7BU_04795, partial [Candidatus Phlomobacter fragariae]